MRFSAQGARVCGLLNLGLAGSFDLKAAPLGAAVAATAEIWPEYGLVGPDGSAQARTLGFPQLTDAAGELWDQTPLDPDQAAQAMGLTLPGDWVRGPSLTVAGASGHPGRAREYRTRFGALTENMEGFPLALACRRWGTPFLEVRTISNPVGEADRTKWRLKPALKSLSATTAALFGGACGLAKRENPVDNRAT